LGINEYLNSLTADCLQAPGIVNLPQDQKDAIAERIKDYFYQAALEVLVGRLNEEQFR